MDTKVKTSTELLTKTEIMELFNKNSTSKKVKITQDSLDTRAPSADGVFMCKVPDCEDLSYVRHGNNIMFTTYANSELTKI